MSKQKYKTLFYDIWLEKLFLKGEFWNSQQAIIWPAVKYAPKMPKTLRLLYKQHFFPLLASILFYKLKLCGA